VDALVDGQLRVRLWLRLWLWLRLRYSAVRFARGALERTVCCLARSPSLESR
jgi:hypothetical protein